MKYIKTFESYLDDLLDKINDSGIDSLTPLEKEWLKAHSTDKQEDEEKIEREMGKRTFESSDNYFRFEFIEMEDYGDEQIIRGTMYVPSIEFEDGGNIEGVLEGEIEIHNGVGVPNFEKEAFGATYDIFEFCNGLEYELDNFLQYIVDELNS